MSLSSREIMNLTRGIVASLTPMKQICSQWENVHFLHNDSVYLEASTGELLWNDVVDAEEQAASSPRGCFMA
jgi:hypothetical protein